MAHVNLPESLYEDYYNNNNITDNDTAYWIHALRSPQPRTKENALRILFQIREIRTDLGPLLWNSFATIHALLQEILPVYRLLSSPRLTKRASYRVSNAIALFQSLASHPDTKAQFLKAQLPLYLYPFLIIKVRDKPREYLRLSSLGVIGALVKAENPEAILFLIGTDIFPCCINSMLMGSDLSKQVATFIIHKILLHDVGMKYCCTYADRFYAMTNVLAQMTEKLAVEPSPRLLKQIIYCYHRISQSPRTCDALRSCLPIRFRDHIFTSQLRGDSITIKCLQELLGNVMYGHQARMQPMRRR